MPTQKIKHVKERHLTVAPFYVTALRTNIHPYSLIDIAQECLQVVRQARQADKNKQVPKGPSDSKIFVDTLMQTGRADLQQAMSFVSVYREIYHKVIRKLELIPGSYHYSAEQQDEVEAFLSSRFDQNHGKLWANLPLWMDNGLSFNHSTTLREFLQQEHPDGEPKVGQVWQHFRNKQHYTIQDHDGYALAYNDGKETWTRTVLQWLDPIGDIWRFRLVKEYNA